jgi:hypothetical protein
MAPKQLGAGFKYANDIAMVTSSSSQFVVFHAQPDDYQYGAHGGLFYCSAQAGCTEPFLQIASNSMVSAISSIIPLGSDLFFSENTSAGPNAPSLVIHKCTSLSEKGCAQMIDIFSSAKSLTVFAADRDSVYFVTEQENPSTAIDLMSCPNSGPCTTATKLASFTDAPNKIISYNGKLYSSQGSGFGGINECVLSNCAQSWREILPIFNPVQDFVVDDTTVYWLSNSNGWSLMTCALPNCPGGPRSLLKDLVEPRFLHLWRGFIYWASKGTKDNSGDSDASTGAIYRVAVPLQ